MLSVRLAIVSILVFGQSVGAQSPIRWEPYDLPPGTTGVTAQLGHLRVPLLRTNPAGPHADLAFVRLQSTNRGAGSPIVYLSGGPGQAAIGAARSPFALPNLARLAEVGDVILLDQRGIGLSSPRPSCTASSAPAPADRLPESRRLTQVLLTRIRACVREWAAKDVDARAFTNRESAADIEDLRIALGAERVSLYGFSYGTHLALAFARYFPASIDRMVLANTAGLSDMQKLPLVSDMQIAKLSALIARDTAVGALVPYFAGSFARIVERIKRQPIALTIHDVTLKQDVQITLGVDAFRRLVMQDLGDGNDIPVFPALVHTMERGDMSMLAGFVERRYNESGGGVNLMYYGMRCSAGASPARNAEIRSQAVRSVFGNISNGLFPEVCAALPKGMDLGEQYRAPVSIARPVLFLSGTLDNNTPPYQAEQLRWGMPFATHIVVENAGHEDLLPNADIQRAIRDFLSGRDVGDRRIVLPLRFLGIEEAKRQRQRARR